MLAVVLGLALASCGDDGGSPDAAYPDVVEATATFDDPTWTFAVTISSPYDAADRYADAWRVVGPDGDVHAVRELTHHHAAEQPFTRSLGGITIPDGVDEVTIEGRDLVNGWGGATVTIALDSPS